VGGDPVSFTDPSGHVPLPVITGVIGGISGGAGYVVGKLVSGGCISGRELGVAIGVGAVQGALAPFAPGIGGAIGLGAATNLTQDAINGAADGKILSPREVALSLGLGGLSGAIAGAWKPTPKWYDRRGGSFSDWAAEGNKQRAIRENVAVASAGRNVLGSAVSTAGGSLGGGGGCK
jgi:hypothetical protein